MQKETEKREPKDGFVKLRGVAADSVAKIDSPWQRCGDAVGMVGKPCEKASDAADGYAESDRRGEQIAGRVRLADAALGPLDGEQAANQRADDRLAAKEICRIAPMRDGQRRIFEPIED